MTDEILNILNMYIQATKHQHKGNVYKPKEEQTEVTFVQLEKDWGMYNKGQEVTCY